MAVEKLSEGIRRFDADARKLEGRALATRGGVLRSARGRLIKTELEARAGGRVARISFDNPAKLNILTPDALRLFSREMHSLEKEANLRAVVLTGRGDKAFIGGADLETLGSLDPVSAREFIALIHEACAAVRDCPLPVIARINGWCLGAGLELAACCDLRIAVDTRGLRHARSAPRHPLGGRGRAAAAPRRRRPRALAGDDRGNDQRLRGSGLGSHRKISRKKEFENTVNHALDAILAGSDDAIRAQKRLCKLWEEAPLAESIRASIDEFARSYESGEPNRRVDAFREARRRKA